jgi:hypothetical protein
LALTCAVLQCCSACCSCGHVLETLLCVRCVCARSWSLRRCKCIGAACGT